MNKSLKETSNPKTKSKSLFTQYSNHIRLNLSFLNLKLNRKQLKDQKINSNMKNIQKQAKRKC